MPNAKNVLKVTFEEAMEKVRGVQRGGLVVRFRYRNCDDEEVIVKSIRASALYKDWYGDCNICPANDAVVTRLRILINPSCTALDITHDVVFERFMDTLEAVTVGWKHVD